MDEKLKIELLLPEKINFGDHKSIISTLRFTNTGKEKINIYLVNSENFRSFQSYVRIFDKDRKQVIVVFPDPHPHGYITSEKDFHMIEPGETKEFTQTLYFQKPEFLTGGVFLVEWNYENHTTSMPGGVNTLDGVTKPLFNGKEIPYIWTGKLSTTCILNL